MKKTIHIFLINAAAAVMLVNALWALLIDSNTLLFLNYLQTSMMFMAMSYFVSSGILLTLAQMRK